MTSEVLTVEQAAKVVGITERVYRDRMRRGKLPGLDLDGVIRVPKRALDYVLEKGRMPGPDAVDDETIERIARSVYREMRRAEIELAQELLGAREPVKFRVIGR